jgi:ribosomal peptide maturation radical SAM protein 1
VDIAPRTARRPVTGDVEALDAETALARSRSRVALLAMPFQDLFRPSIQIGLLKSIVASHGFPAETFHFNLDFARALGKELVEVLFGAAGEARGMGDWLFSVAAFGDQAPDPSGAFLFDSDLGLTEHEVALVASFRESGVDRYLDELVKVAVDWKRYRVVGFTTTFAQTVPSLALARRLKQHHPHLTVVFGGANLDGPMGIELVRSMPCIDYGITGEADVTFTELLVAISEGRDPTGLPGVLSCREGQVAHPPPGVPFDRLDELPTPDYREYFDRAARYGIVADVGRHQIWLPIESSRGCWWGAKRHCTFCGLNGLTMSHRSKSAARVKDELAELAATTGSLRVCFVDNIIDTDYFDQLFPAINDSGADYRMFYAVKANMTREQLRTMRDGGVLRIQPGIESLSSRVLGLMRKGVRAAQNVNFLRWARFYGIGVAWNLIYGFPKESADDCREQVELIPKLVHLDPPAGAGRIWMERFSPIFEDRASFPAKWTAPEKRLQYVYPPYVDLTQLAYVFDYVLEDALPESEFDELRKAVAAWNDANADGAQPSLTLHRASDFVQIIDRRDVDTVAVHTFEGDLAALYDQVMEKPKSARMIAEQGCLPHRAEEIEDAMDEFVARGLMMRDGNLFLSLALPASPWR